MIGSFDLASFFVWFLAFLFSTTCHEAAHALVAHLGGDSTAYEGGQVSLDPMPHIRREPFGMIVAPILVFMFSGTMIGWASAPYDPHWAQRHPKRHALMALAGPGTNLLLAILAVLVMKALVMFGYLVPTHSWYLLRLVEPVSDSPRSVMAAIEQLLSVLVYLNLLLCAFNLIPISPLDGSAVVEGFFERQTGRFYRALRESQGLSILMFILAWSLFNRIWDPLHPILGRAARFILTL